MRLIKFAALFLVLAAIWTAIAIVLAFYGTWMTPIVAPDDKDGFVSWATNRLAKENLGTSAFVLIDDGEISQHYERADADTLFPTASFSKLIAALTVMTLVEDGRLDLDAPISTYTDRWAPPETEFATAGLTPRRLLSHTAGLTDGLGFGDYHAHETLPSTLESLRAPRASTGTASIRVGAEPGAEFQYSGGGYLVLEFLVEEITGMSFADYATAHVLAPLGLRRSNFDYLGDEGNASPSFNADGTQAEAYKYASAAATGLNSTAADLTALVQALLAGGGGALQAETMRTMRTGHAQLYGADIWGLGFILYAPTPGGSHVYGHDGANAPALNTSVRINPDTGDAIIALVSGQPLLASDIAAEWTLWQTGYPDVFSTTRILASAGSPAVVGWGVLLLGVMLLVRPRAKSDAANPSQ